MTTANVTESSLEIIFISGGLTGGKVDPLWRSLLRSSVFYKEELGPQSGFNFTHNIHNIFRSLIIQ